MAMLDEIGRGRYISLTTYRRDGTGVATPVWHAVKGTELLLISDADAGKVKRIRKNNTAVVSVCDARGRIAPDAPSARGAARLLGEAETASARALIARKYALSRIGNWLVKILHLPKRPVIGIAVTLVDARVGDGT